jgi:MerR family transcriptional regulator/heat shock protein HspR
MAGSGCEPVFVISVAARLLEMHPQTLRKYEREGLIAPSRTSGNLRLYSDEDLDRLRQVKYLVGDRGLNVAGVQMALHVTEHLRALEAWLAESEGRDCQRTLERVRAELGSLMTVLGASDPATRR